MHKAARSARTSRVVDNTDWLKVTAIIAVAIGHIGYFFIDDDHWWGVLGRLGAPTLFFLMGYAQSRVVPFHWILLGVILTLLESWNADWTWVPTNVFFSFALIRIARPYVQFILQDYGWAAFALLVSALFAVLPMASPTVDYGAEGWLWALFGLLHRMHVDSRSGPDVNDAAKTPAPLADSFAKSAEPMRLLACGIALVVYVWQEQKEFEFLQTQLAAVMLSVGFLSACLCLFRRGPSRIQPSETIARVLCFVGRHTLEIYAIQLAGSELIKKLWPSLSP